LNIFIPPLFSFIFGEHWKVTLIKGTVKRDFFLFHETASPHAPQFSITMEAHFLLISGLTGSVVDTEPESDPDLVGSKTFCKIRIRSQIQNKSFRIRIRAALIRNEFERKLL
jgi:hypothetical protein